MDEITGREEMKASENTRLAGGDFALHRVDPDRVSKLLGPGADPAGYARLSLMVGTIFDRLVAGERRDPSGL